MQSIDPIETYAYGTSKNIVSDKEEIKCNNIIKGYENWQGIDKVALSSNDDKRMQSIDPIETCIWNK